MVVKIRKTLETVRTLAIGRILNEEELESILLICAGAIERTEKEYEEYCKTAAESHEGIE